MLSEEPVCCWGCRVAVDLELVESARISLAVSILASLTAIPHAGSCSCRPWSKLFSKSTFSSFSKSIAERVLLLLQGVLYEEVLPDGGKRPGSA